MGKNKTPEKPKAKKEKVTYVDDGSTVFDMSGTRAPAPKPRPRPTRPGKPSKPAPTSRYGQAWQTDKDAVRAMVGPMLITIGGISVIFFLIWLILGFFS